MPNVSFNYQLANTAGYKFDIVNLDNNAYDTLSYYYKENFPDLKITRPNTDLSLLYNKALITINGFIYPTIYNNTDIIVPSATHNMLRSRTNNVGIYSFGTLPDNLTKIPITSDMISGDNGTSLYNKVFIDFPNPINSFILIIAGYMIFENTEFLYRVSPTTFALRLDKLMYIEKLYELQKYRDIFTELGLQINTNNPSLIDSSLAKSDSIITKFLTLNNSFLVEIPVNSLTVEKIYLEHSNVPGNFRTEIKPTYPILVGYGKIGEYFKKKTNENKYTVYLSDAYYSNYLFSTMNIDKIKLYNDNRIIGKSYSLTHGYFLKVSGTI